MRRYTYNPNNSDRRFEVYATHLIDPKGGQYPTQSHPAPDSAEQFYELRIKSENREGDEYEIHPQIPVEEDASGSFISYMDESMLNGVERSVIEDYLRDDDIVSEIEYYRSN